MPITKPVLNIMKIKVCGLTMPSNIQAVSDLGVDLLGFIFYPPSPRYVGDKTPAAALEQLGSGQQKTGVFVNESVEKVLEYAREYYLDTIQLHGHESPEECARLRVHYPIIKAFPIAEIADFGATAAYAGVCDYFLFDTKGPKHGGNGRAFDWDILSAYAGDTPFLLSGGIGPDDAARIRNIQHDRLAGVDLNSRFESSPGVKDIGLLRRFLLAMSFKLNT